MTAPEPLSASQLDAYRQAEVIFIAQDGYTLAPARVRAYNFAAACRDRGMRAEVLSIYDHLGSGGQGSTLHQTPDWAKLVVMSNLAQILGMNPRAILYSQKVNYHTVTACAVAATQGNQLVVDYDDYDFTNPIFPYLQRYIPHFDAANTTASIMTAADRCVVSSHGLLDMVTRFNPNTTLLPTGTDLGHFNCGLRDDSRQGPVEIIWLGDFWGSPIVNDVFFALSAYANLPPAIRDMARFRVIGFGAVWEQTKALMAREFGDIRTIVPLERIAPAEAPALLAGCDIGALPLADTEFSRCKSPTKMFEYMAMKVAVCGTPVGEVAQILRDGENGMLAMDLEGYAMRLAMLILDADKRRAVAEAAYRTVLDGLHLGIIGDRLVELLRGLQAEKPAAPAS